MSLIPSAIAAGTTSAATGSASGFMQFLPMVVIFALFWLLLIRPQQKKMKLHNQMLAALDKGSKVLTNGGIVGTIVKLENDFVEVEIASGVIITMQRSAIAGKLDTTSTTK
jgi:preprotein translocase subunit YajC